MLGAMSVKPYIKLIKWFLLLLDLSFIISEIGQDRISPVIA